MDESAERPPFVLMIDPYFTVYRGRRRTLVSGQPPAGVGGDRPPHARAWRACQNSMNEETAWERAARYRHLMGENGHRSIRALARATGENHSRISRVLKVLDLPEGVLAALRARADDIRVRTHFNEKRLRQMAVERRSEKAILQELRRILAIGETSL